MNRKQRTLAALVLLFVVAGTSYAFLEWQSRPVDDPDISISAPTSTQATTTEPTAPEPEPLASDHGFGTVTLRLNEVASFPNGFSMRPVAVVEDSRCPENARCVWAGQVRVSVRVRSGMGTSNHVLTLGGPSVTTEAEEISLVGVEPGKLAGKEIANADYRLTFQVTERIVIKPPAQCYIGGCSAQLCTDDPGAVSTCEYRAEYACYKTAECKRQQNGQCGWTETSELKSCLLDPPELE